MHLFTEKCETPTTGSFTVGLLLLTLLSSDIPLSGSGNQWATISGTHTYAVAGNYTITMSAPTSTSPSTVAVSSAIVSAAPSPLIVDITTVNLPPAGPINVSVAALPSPTTTGVANSQLNTAWSTAPLKKLPAITPTVINRWGDGTHYSLAATVDASTRELKVSGMHTYARHGRYRAVAIFMKGHKVIRRVIEHFTITKLSAP